MSQISAFHLPDNAVVFVESAEPDPVGGEQRASSLISLNIYGHKDDKEKLPDLSERVQPIIDALHVVQRKLVRVGSPDAVELSAGIKFTGEAGVILSKYGAEASISLKLTWKKPGVSVETSAEESDDKE